jgi:serine/threonine protein kinase
VCEFASCVIFPNAIPSARLVNLLSLAISMDLLQRGDRGSRLASYFRPEVNAARSLTDFLMVTRRLKRYEEDELETLGQLSAGTSFQTEKCRDVSTGSIVVVKKLHEVHDEGGDTRLIPRAVVEEMKISVWPAFLKHPNITRTLGYQYYARGDGTSVLALVVEHSAIGTLEDFFKSGELDDWELKRILALDVALGLEVLHRYQVVHGDIKPSNILLFRRASPTGNSSFLAKLSDFGNAVAENSTTILDGARIRSTYRGTALWEPPITRNHLGTLPFYLLPRCDVFSFGLVVWSIFKAGFYFEKSWQDASQSKEECLDDLGVSGLLQKFYEFRDANLTSLPEDLHKSVANLVESCMRPEDLLETSSKPLPNGTVELIKENFSTMARLRGLLEEPQQQGQR